MERPACPMCNNIICEHDWLWFHKLRPKALFIKNEIQTDPLPIFQRARCFIFGTVLPSETFMTLEELYIRYFPAVVNYCRARCGDEAEDIAQDVFIKIFDKAEAYRGFEKRLVFTVARYEIIDNYRHNRWMRSVQNIDLLPLLSREPLLEPPDPRNFSASTKKLLFRLRKRERQVVLLKFVFGFTFKEIAKTMKISQGGAYGCLRGGLKNLRKHAKN